MKDEDKTKEQLINECVEMRRQVAELEELLSKRKWADEFSRKLIMTSPIGIYIVQDRKFKSVSPRFQEITGYRENELLGMDSLDIVLPEDREMVRESAREMLKGTRSSPYEFRIFTRAGEVRWIMELVVSIHYQVRRATLGNFMDVTKHRQAEEEAKKSRDLINMISNFAGIADREGALQFVNRKALEDLGFGEGELIGLPFWECGFFTPSSDVVEKIRDSIDAALRGKQTRTEITCFSKDGRQVQIYYTSAPMFDDADEVVGIVLEGVEITQLKEKEEALAKEKELLAITLRSIGDGVICTDAVGDIVLMNRVAEDLTGWSEKEAIGKALHEVFYIINEKTRRRCDNPVEKVLETGGVVDLANHTVLVSRDGTERILADSGAPIRGKDGETIGVVLVFRDVTERRRIAEELHKIEKLESIGILAGGIAHDFNNILTGILGNITLVKMYAEPSDEVFEKLTEAEKASLRAKDLTQHLLTFSKGGAPTKKTASIAELLKDSVSFALRGSNVRCEFFLPEDLWPVEADEGQMNQVINNLVINAQQAMPEGGVMNVRAENMAVGKKHALPLKKGKYVKIAIEDQGIGISKEHLPRIFDPYFTTKQKGSGLDLSTAYSIIKNHDGYISVESGLGEGTRFHIYLPASEKKISEKKTQEEKPLFGQGRILVMDDEEIVRNVAGEMLKSIGYEVEFARDGAEAIEVYKKAKETGNAFDAVIMDLTVPGGMGGNKALQELLEIDPQVKAVVSSGYSNDPVMSDYKKYGFRGVMAKPYKIKELGEVIYKAVTEPDHR